MRSRPATLLVFILLMVLVNSPNTGFSQSFDPSSNKTETIKFIDNILKKTLGTINNWTVSEISFTENGYKIAKGNDTIKYSYVYTSIPWENVEKVRRFPRANGCEVKFRFPFKGVENGKIIDEYYLYFDLYGDLSSYNNDLEAALNHLVSLSRTEKGVSAATLEQTLNYIQTRLSTYQSSAPEFRATLLSDQGIDQPLSFDNYYKTVIDHVSIYYNNLKSIELLQGNIVLSGKVNIYGKPRTRPTAVTIYLTDQMPVEDKQKLLKAFKHIAYLLEVKLSNDDLF